MLYSDLMAGIEFQQNAAGLVVPEDWLQGRSMFGGLQAALAVQAMRQLTPQTLPLRTLQTTFMAPIPAGTVTAIAQVLRQGKNTYHVEARIQDGNQTQALCIGVFGAGRDSALSRTIAPPKLPQTDPKPFVFNQGTNPSFTQHFSAQWLRGDLPFSGSSDTTALVDVSMKDSSNASEAHLLAIADFIPPVALSLLTQPSPGSSLTWMIELLNNDWQDQPLSHWLVDAEMTAAGEGYTSQTATIYAPDGNAVALSRQSMVVFG